MAREGTKPRRAGERLAGSYVNFYIANGGIVMPLLDPRTDAGGRARAASACFRGGAWWACRRARSCWAGATSTASRSRCPAEREPDHRLRADPGPASGPCANVRDYVSRPCTRVFARACCCAQGRASCLQQPAPAAAATAPRRALHREAAHGTLQRGPRAGERDRHSCRPAGHGGAAHLCRHAHLERPARHRVRGPGAGAPACGSAG